MATSESTLKTSSNSAIIIFSSLIIPGLGQFLLKKRGNGLVIFITTAISAFLINWSFTHQNIGKITLGTFTTSWLWLSLILFWVWNVLDARASATGGRFSILPALICIGII